MSRPAQPQKSKSRPGKGRPQSTVNSAVYIACLRVLCKPCFGAVHITDGDHAYILQTAH